MNRDQDQEYISKATMTNLFRITLGYHRRRLREIFRAHFNPFKTDAVWTKDLPEQVINESEITFVLGSWTSGVLSQSRTDWNQNNCEISRVRCIFIYEKNHQRRSKT